MKRETCCIARPFSAVLRAILLALALSATGGAWAAIKPVAVWNGDFSTTTRGDFTITLNGNEVASDGSKITIKGSGTATAGVFVGTTATTYSSIACIVGFKAGSCDKSGKPVFMATSNNRTNGEHLTGLLLDTDGYVKGFWTSGGG